MGTAHQFNSEEAANAGKKGGKLLAEKKGLSYMAEIGRRGGSARKIKVTTATQTPAAAPAVTE
jgi:general stress protein YciG